MAEISGEEKRLRQWIGQYFRTKDFSPSDSYKTQFVARPDKATLAIEHLKDEAIDLSRAVCVSVGGADGSDVLALMGKTDVQHGILLEYDHEQAQRARSGAAGLSPKALDVLQGDAASNLSRCRAILDRLQFEHNVNTVIVFAFAVLHELETAARSARMDYDHFFGTLFRDFPNRYLFSREPSTIAQWPDRVQFRIGGSDSSRHLDAGVVAEVARLLSAVHKREPGDVTEVADGYVLAPATIAAETIRRILYIVSEEEFRYELDEFHSAFDVEALAKRLRKYFPQGSVSTRPTNSQTFQRLYKARRVEALDIRDSSRLQIPLVFTELICEQVTEPAHVHSGSGSQTSGDRQYHDSTVNHVSSYSKMLTPENLFIPAHRVLITIDLRCSAITARSQNQLAAVAPKWNQLQSVRDVPSDIIDAFDVKNGIRTARGVGVDKADVPLLRLIAQPSVNREHLGLILAPVGWDVYTVTKAYPDFAKEHSATSYFPSDKLQRDVLAYLETLHRVPGVGTRTTLPVGPRDLTPVGIEALVVTVDGQVLLRHKDRATAIGGNQWDVSFSGYARLDAKWGVSAGDEDTEGLLQLDLNTWAAHEFWRETGAPEAALLTESAVVFGVHQNVTSGSIDILYCAATSLTAEQLLDHIHLKRWLAIRELAEKSRSGRDWDTETYEQRRLAALAEIRTKGTPDSRGAAEKAVADTRNVLKEFGAEKIAEFRTQVVALGEEWLPEASWLLTEALKFRNRLS